MTLHIDHIASIATNSDYAPQCFGISLINGETSPNEKTSQPVKQEPADTECFAPEEPQTYVLTDSNFDMIGPFIAEHLRNFGVFELRITEGLKCFFVEAKLNEVVYLPQDPFVDACRELVICASFSGEISELPDGSLLLENVKGLYSEIKLQGEWIYADVTKIRMSSDDDGNTRVKCTGELGSIKRRNTRIRPSVVIEETELLVRRIKRLKNKVLHFTQAEKSGPYSRTDR